LSIVEYNIVVYDGKYKLLFVLLHSFVDLLLKETQTIYRAGF